MINFETNSNMQTSLELIPVNIFDDSDQASSVIANDIINQINNTDKSRPFVLGLATGSTPIKVYQKLIAAYDEGKVSFVNVVTFNLDEYYPMEPDSIHSYVEFMHKNLFDHIDIPKKNIHIPDGTINYDSHQSYCESYEQSINAFGGIDIQLLGIGRTGHIGFNEPGSSISSQTRLVWLDNVTRKDAASGFFGEDFVPKQAITMGISSIMKAKKVYLMAWGEGKSHIIKRTVEGPVSDQIPATYLQQHDNCVFILDKASSSELTRQKTPWLLGPCLWQKNLVKKAVIWLADLCQKSILKLTKEDYETNHLQSILLAFDYSVTELNLQVYNSLLHTFSLWEVNKAPKPSVPSKALIFSPHPDDDVISMGGTLIQLADNGYEVHVAYQTSGNIAVFDDEVIRFMQFSMDFFPKDERLKSSYNQILDAFNRKKIGDIDTKQIQLLKGSIRKGEALAACRVCGVLEENAHFMNLPFYETGAVKKKPHSKNDVDMTVALLNKLRPSKIFAAGDLSDPHGTHRVCLQILFDAIDQLKNDKNTWIEDTEIWLYRGAWQEWGVDDIEMAVPLSPENVAKKREAIFKHQSQKDRAMFPGPDQREFWQRAEQRNQQTAKTFNLLGLTEYQAVEGFVRYK